MTAEVAILNKSAVVLAADSAVTISRGSSQEKTFDSADKLFELSTVNHVAIMVNGGLDFMEAPLSVLIKAYRDSCTAAGSVEEIAAGFLDFLTAFGGDGPQRIADDVIRQSVNFPFTQIQERASKQFEEKLIDPEFLNQGGEGEEIAKRLMETRNALYARQIEMVSAWIELFPDAEFSGGGAIRVKKSDEKIIRDEAKGILPALPAAQTDALVKIGKQALKKALFSQSKTGIIIAGYGENDVFPTLLSYSLYGVVGGRLKFIRNEKTDIDRSGTRARVVAFAQREMVERFIYGIDEEIEHNVRTFSREGVAAIREAIFSHLTIDGDGLKGLQKAAEEAEDAFLDGLVSEGFKAIRQESEAELEGMVEFMPKIEMARMAEALVNLTSIKRRVSRGMETVGGPIDVAVISKSEGLVWVKRKHYFPAELNSRFFDRKRLTLESTGGETNA